MKINLNGKSSSASLSSYDSHTKKVKEIAGCNVKVETFINDKKDTNSMDCTIRSSSIGKGYKMPNFLTGFHHKAYLENVQTNHGKLRINRYKHSNPMLPPIPYLARKLRVPPSPRLKSNSQKYEENQKVVHISRSTSPINFDNENGDTDVDFPPNEVPLNAEEQILCLEQIAKELRFGQSNETIGDGDKKKERISEIPKDIPLQLLNQSQRLKIKEQNENVEPLEKEERKNKIPEVDESTSKSVDDLSDTSKKSVLQQILYFNEKSKCNNEGKKCTTERNTQKSPRKISSELYRSYGLERLKENMRNLEIKDSNDSFQSDSSKTNNDENARRKLVTTRTKDHTNEAKGNLDKAKAINELFQEYSSGSLSSANSMQSYSDAHFGKEKNENNNLKQDKFLNHQINRNELRVPKVLDGTTNSIIDSIKSKFFKNTNIPRTEREKPTKRVGPENQESNVKFPKETRTAVMLLMNNSNNNSKEVRFAVSEENIDHQKVKRHNNHRRQHHHQNQASEVQLKRHPEFQTLTKTSYVRGNVNVFKNSSHLPCPKNLLCEKGVHRGKCGKLYENRCEKEMLTCQNRCKCRKMSYWCPECQNIWPGKARRYDKNDNDDDKDNEKKLSCNEMEDCLDSIVREDLICYRCRKIR